MILAPGGIRRYAGLMRRIHADLLLLVAAAVWGFAFLFQKSAIEHVGPILFVAARGAVAALALLPFAIVEMRSAGTGWTTVLHAGVTAGIAFYVAAVLQQWGLVTATVTNTGFLTALYVVATPFIAWALLGRRPPPLVWLAVILSFVGTWLLGGGTLAAFSAGDGLVALSAVFWALHVVLVGRAAPLGRPVAFTCLQFVVVGVLGAASAPMLETVTMGGLTRAWMEIAYVGLLSSALTFTMFSMALRYTGPSEATVIVSTETLFAAFGAWLVLGERLPLIGWAGAALILTATMAVQLAPTRAGSPRIRSTQGAAE
ncbi:MAG: DMT family transporter [Hyphomicrobiaceae bacterium]|nr:DMT family transporter [Hyphomicrobiaceae bacterium]